MFGRGNPAGEGDAARLYAAIVALRKLREELQSNQYANFYTNSFNMWIDVVANIPGENWQRLRMTDGQLCQAFHILQHLNPTLAYLEARHADWVRSSGKSVPADTSAIADGSKTIDAEVVEVKPKRTWPGPKLLAGKR
jgi:hypothetical protein